MTKIYYFSGTGNSLWSAKKIAQGITDAYELYNIGAESQKKRITVEADAVVFVFPSYAYGMPLVVRRFAKSAVFKTRYFAAFVTFGTSPRGTLGLLRRILKKKGIEKMFFGLIPSVENYLALFGRQKPEKKEKRILLQEKTTKDAIQAVIERRENKVSVFCPFSALVSRLFSLGVKIFYKRYRIGENCNGCAVCEKICPVSAITMSKGYPVFSSKCEHCQGCVDICPLRAIQFGRVKFGSLGYCHPEIEITELGL
jgi:ferredoxin